MTVLYKLTDSTSVTRTSDGMSIPPGKNRYWIEYQAWLGAGNTPDPADPIPDPEPTSAEQLDALVAQSKAVLEKASTIDDMKVIVGGLIDGMKDIYGTKS